MAHVGLPNAVIRTCVLVLAAALMVGCADSYTYLGEPADARLTVFLETADSRPDKTALLVGIDRYEQGESREFADLEGCVNDVRLVKRLLIDRFGFEERNVFVLLDEEATHERIVRAFHEVLIRRAREGTEAFFYLSGHGSRTPDASGHRSAERDLLDSTFVAYDSRAEGRDGERDLVDDELRSLVVALTAKTDRVTVVTDSCHSGEMMRGEERARTAPRAKRGVDREWLESFWPSDVELTEDTPDAEPPADRYVHIAAAERHERAWEFEATGPDGGTVTHGVLTFLLARAMESAPAEATWREIVDDVAVRVSVLKPQTVNYLGDVDRRLFGGGHERVAGFRAEARDASRLLVHAGWLHGLRVGSLLEVRGSGGRRVLGEARVEAVTATASRAAWTDDRPAEMPPGSLRALELSRAAGEPPLRIHVEVPELLEALVDVELVETIGTPESSDYRLVRRGRDALRLETAEGLPVHARPIPFDGEATPASLEALEAVFRDELRWRALDLLATERGALPLRLSFRSATPADFTWISNDADLYHPVEILGGADAEGLPNGSRRVRGSPPLSEEELARARDAGERPLNLGVLEVENPHDCPLYVYLFSLEEARAMTPILPRKGELPVRLEPGKSRRKLISLVAPREWPFDRPMRDRYVAVSTLVPVDLSEFRSPGAVRGGEAPPPPLIRRAMEGPLIRGGDSAAVDTADWGVTRLDLLVESP